MKAYAKNSVKFTDSDTDCAGNRTNGRPSRFSHTPGKGGDISLMRSQRKGGNRRTRTALNKAARTALKASDRASDMEST